MKRKDVLKRLSELLECSKECVEYSVKDGDTEALEFAIKELGGVDIKSLSKQISESLLKRTAQEITVQEQLKIIEIYKRNNLDFIPTINKDLFKHINTIQYLGNCKKCNHINRLKISKELIKRPNYCMECGSKIIYQKIQEI